MTANHDQYIDFAALKAALSITRVLEHYRLLPGLKSLRGGDAFTGCCPIHRGTNHGQFKVSVSKNCWNCFGDCGRGGGALDFTAGSDPALKGRFSAAPASKAREHGAGNPPLGFELKSLQRDHPYLRERGLCARTVQTFGLGLCLKGTMAGRIVIPVHNACGHLVGYAGRWPGVPPRDRPRYRLPLGFRKSLELFSLHRALREESRLPLIVTEGFFDVIHLWQCGFRTAVALMGSTLSPAQGELLIRAAKNRPGLILLFDGDGAGRAGRQRALLRLAEHTFVRAVELPGESAQPDHFTARELQTLLALP